MDPKLRESLMPQNFRKVEYGPDSRQERAIVCSNEKLGVGSNAEVCLSSDVHGGELGPLVMQLPT